jgi:DNA-binding CsgD family transcriptional regulator
VLAETGRRQAALTGLRRLVANDFGLFRRDSLFLASLAILGCTAVALGDVPRARTILTTLAPYATRNLVQGVPVGWGSAAWHLGRLAALAGDDRGAAKYRAVADDLHARWMAGPWGPPAVEQSGGPLREHRLSRREEMVLGLLADGRANKDIAATLGISVHTVERHVANVFGKLGVHNRAEAAAWAVRHEIGQSTT